jgi:hypothetical protein
MSKPESFTKEQKLSYLMTTTGKSKIACDIALQLAGNDVDRAIDTLFINDSVMMMLEAAEAKLKESDSGLEEVD